MRLLEAIDKATDDRFIYAYLAVFGMVIGGTLVWPIIMFTIFAGQGGLEYITPLVMMAAAAGAGLLGGSIALLAYCLGKKFRR